MPVTKLLKRRTKVAFKIKKIYIKFYHKDFYLFLKGSLKMLKLFS